MKTPYSIRYATRRLHQLHRLATQAGPQPPTTINDERTATYERHLQIIQHALDDYRRTIAHVLRANVFRFRQHLDDALVSALDRLILNNEDPLTVVSQFATHCHHVTAKHTHPQTTHDTK